MNFLIPVAPLLISILFSYRLSPRSQMLRITSYFVSQMFCSVLPKSKVVKCFIYFNLTHRLKQTEANRMNTHTRTAKEKEKNWLRSEQQINSILALCCLRLSFVIFGTSFTLLSRVLSFLGRFYANTLCHLLWHRCRAPANLYICLVFNVHAFCLIEMTTFSWLLFILFPRYFSTSEDVLIHWMIISGFRMESQCRD